MNKPIAMPCRLCGCTPPRSPELINLDNVAQRVLVDVATVTGVSLDVISRRGRVTRRVTHARWAWWWLTRELVEPTWMDLARAVGGFDHATVMHGCRRAMETRARDIVLAILNGHGAVA